MMQRVHLMNLGGDIQAFHAGDCECLGETVVSLSIQLFSHVDNAIST